jgi:hypothetical protein
VRLREQFGGHDSTRRWAIGEGPGRRRLLSSERELISVVCGNEER